MVEGGATGISTQETVSLRWQGLPEEEAYAVLGLGSRAQQMAICRAIYMLQIEFLVVGIIDESELCELCAFCG